jgi:ATP-dependent DNA helicase RecG
MREFNARHHMEKAIEVMRQSIAEPRKDGKASPKVGAVLLDVGDVQSTFSRVTTAFRGELRQGDHAEYTVLERKNRDRDLSNCVLFATLEPCAPKSRNHPKLGCAERIVLARIKEVWVGIEDPDPKVDRKGITYLQENGVQVHMFDRDLQEIIRAENREFIEQALERAVAAADKKPREIILSPLESSSVGSRVEEFASAALDAYRASAKFKESTDSSDFRNRLVRQGLLQRDGDRFVPTGFGMLLFGHEPRTTMPQAGLLGTIHFPDGTEEVKSFEGPQVLVPDQVLEWLEGKLPNIIDRSQAVRKQKRDAFFELIREGVVNALVHRDYGITGAKCHLSVFPDKIEIRSPGKPVEPITLVQMQSFDAPMLSRNPVLHYVFAKMGMAEERGLGLKSMQQRAENAGLPLPKYSWADPYLVLTLFPSLSSATATLPAKVRELLNEKEQAGFQWLATKKWAKSADYAKALGIDIRTARRHLKHFSELGLARAIGAGPSTEYEVL